MDRTTRQVNADLDIRVPLGTLRLDVFYINYEAPVPGWSYGHHAHSSWELHFISAGKGTLRVGDRKLALGPGTFYLTGPGVYHEQKADRREPMDEFCVNFDLLASPARRAPPHLSDEIDEISATFASAPFWFGRDQFGTVRLFEEVFWELESRWVGHYAAIQNRLSLIVLNALRGFVGPKVSRARIPLRPVNDSRRYLVDGYFQTLDRPRTRQELAGILGTSVRNLNRILVSTYGLSFRQLLVRNRLDLAGDLLLNSDLAVRDVAAKVGFRLQSAFTKSFKSHFGSAPARYRKEAP